MNGTKQLLYVSGGIEALTGVIAIVSPSTVVWLLWAVPLTVGGALIGRTAGVALISLAVACWPSTRAETAQVRGLFTYNGLVSALFLVIALRTPFVGILLWPAVALHIVITVLFFVAWRRASVIAEEAAH